MFMFTHGCRHWINKGRVVSIAVELSAARRTATTAADAGRMLLRGFPRRHRRGFTYNILFFRTSDGAEDDEWLQILVKWNVWHFRSVKSVEYRTQRCQAKSKSEQLIPSTLHPHPPPAHYHPYSYSCSNIHAWLPLPYQTQPENHQQKTGMEQHARASQSASLTHSNLQSVKILPGSLHSFVDFLRPCPLPQTRRTLPARLATN